MKSPKKREGKLLYCCYNSLDLPCDCRDNSRCDGRIKREPCNGR